jgi:hypothetical protein
MKVWEIHRGNGLDALSLVEHAQNLNQVLVKY